jgi:hypothetical protein
MGIGSTAVIGRELCWTYDPVSDSVYVRQPGSRASLRRFESETFFQAAGPVHLLKNPARGVQSHRNIRCGTVLTEERGI